MDFLNSLDKAFDPNKNGFNASIDNSNKVFETAFDPNKNNVATTFTNVGTSLRDSFNIMDQTFKNIFDGDDAKKFYGDTDNFFNHTIGDNTNDFLKNLPDNTVNPVIHKINVQLEGFSDGIMHTLENNDTEPDNNKKNEKVIPNTNTNNKKNMSSYTPIMILGGGFLLLFLLQK